jgi:hypothetical protein
MRILPVDGKGFVDLQVLAGFDTSAAKNTLLRIVAVERLPSRSLNRPQLCYTGTVSRLGREMPTQSREA